MRYLVSTPCGIFLVEKNKARKVYPHSCYGISWSKDHIFACQRSGHKDKFDTIIVLNKQFKVEAAYETKIKGVHQAYYDPETDLLYVVNTHYGKIEFMRQNGELLRPAAWGFARSWNNKRNYVNNRNNHLNSIWKHRGNFWIVEHNYSKPSNIKCVNGEINKVIDNIHIGSQLHNVAIVDDHMYFCHSTKALIRRYHMGKRKGAGSKELIYGECKYTRGLAISKNRVLVGVSTHCPRVTRGVGVKSIHITELNHNLRVTNDIEIKKVNQCCEIRLLGEEDFAHNGIIMDI